jgi:PleD family two-component response regulator
MDKIQELIKKAENKVNSTMLSNIRKTEINLILLEIQNEAINYTRCCTELKDKEKISFDEWLRVEDIKKHQDGTFYISSERRYVELNFLINRYNSLNL